MPFPRMVLIMISLYTWVVNIQNRRAAAQAIISLADVTEYSVINRITLTSWVEETDLAPELRQQVAG